jgi:hypothetical protein
MTSAVGLVLMVVSEAGTLAHLEPFWSWNTPIAWTGFILFADGVVWRARRNSWMRSNPKEFAFLAIVSIPLWLVFELYNRFLQNWYYVGLPENVLLRYFGYAWSFGTIWPAILEGADLMAAMRSGQPGAVPPEVSGRGLPATSARPTPAALSAVSIIAGALMLASPFFVSSETARYLAAPVWLGFVFLLDPINARLGEESLTNDLASGHLDRLKNLLLSGFLCGVLWEFWNYWSRAKWHYSVPIAERLKLFEMPVPGYLGFPAFALECFTMYVFVRAVSGRRGRALAL